MEKTIKNIYRQILSNTLPEEHIPPFLNYLADDYHTIAGVRLAMHYFSFYETWIDEGEQWSKASQGMMKKLNGIISNKLLSHAQGEELEMAVGETDRLRNDIMNHMMQLTAYTDIFQNYEYILNRIEYRFKETVEAEDDEEFSKEILRYIFDTDNNAIINEKIREIIGQLPIRMTKQKYFDLLSGSLIEYKGAPSDTLESYLYMLRTSAMVISGTEMERLYPDLWEKKEFLGGLPFKEITQKDYERASQVLQEAIRFLQGEVNIYYSLQEIVNECYGLLICSPYIGLSTSPYQKQGKVALAIISDVSSLFIKGEKEEPSEKILLKFHELEGVQEELSFDLTTLEEALYQIDQDHRSLVEGIMADKLLNVLLLSKKLLSESLFIDFYELTLKGPVSEEQIKAESDKLIGQLTDVFENVDRMVMRSVMASTLNKMPVFFQDHKEVMDYVLYSLEKCTDKAEKLACMEIIKDIMLAMNS